MIRHSAFAGRDYQKFAIFSRPCVILILLQGNPMEPLPFEKNDFLEHLFNAIPTPIFIVDDDVRILYLNTAAIETFGFIKEKVFESGGAMPLAASTPPRTPPDAAMRSFASSAR